MVEEAAGDGGAGLREALARRLEAEDALVAASPAAALAWAVAGLLRIAHGPGAVGLPLAHLVRLDGAAVAELVGLGGGSPRPVGTALDCPESELAGALDGAAVGLLVVGCGAAEVLAPAAFLWRCRQAGRPALILDPGSGRWAAWADGGATLVVADGRAVAGVACGILAGTAEAIEACTESPIAAAFRAPEAVRERLSSTLAAREQPEG